MSSSAPAGALSARHAEVDISREVESSTREISREPAIARARTPRALSGLRVPAVHHVAAHHAGGCSIHGATWAAGQGGGDSGFGATALGDAPGAATAAAAAAPLEAAAAEGRGEHSGWTWRRPIKSSGS